MDILSNTVSFNEYWKANFVTTHDVEIVPLYINIFCLYVQLYQCFFNIFFKKVLKLPVFHAYVHLWENIFKSCTSAAVSDFCESTLQLMHISDCKYKIKLHLSQWFPANCATAIAHRNYFSRLYQLNKSSESKL